MNIIQRVKAPTPPFFKTLRNSGLALATLGASILAAPVALPDIVLKIAGYIAVAGSVASAVSQTAVSEPAANRKPVLKSSNKKKRAT